MTLLVVPLSRSESGRLTLDEVDLILGRERVLFEVRGHPLAERLQALGANCEVLQGEPDPRDASAALVTEADSPRVVELARAGAQVSLGHAAPPDSLTSAYAAATGRGSVAALASVAAVMARLRSEDGCPWDIEQTHDSLLEHLIEETEEVAAAVAAGTLGDELEEELGDILLQVLFHARIAEQDGRFDLGGVADTLARKLIRRHPHVFGDVEVADADEVVRNWHAIKAREKDGDKTG